MVDRICIAAHCLWIRIFLHYGTCSWNTDHILRENEEINPTLRGNIQGFLLFFGENCDKIITKYLYKYTK